MRRGRQAPEFIGRLVHRAQRRDRIQRGRQVVEADQRHVVGHAQRRRCRPSAAPKAIWSLAAKIAVKRWRLSQQAVHRQQAAVLVELARHHQRRVEGDAGGLERGAVAAQALVGVGVARVAGDEGDAPVAQLEQVLRGQPRRPRSCRSSAKTGPAPSGCGRSPRRAAPWRRPSAPGRVRRPVSTMMPSTRRERSTSMQRASLGGIPVAADEQRAVAGRVEFVLDAAQRRAVERAVDRLGDHADAQRAPAGQAARHRVGHEAQLGNGLVDRAASCLADRRPCR